LQEVAEKSVGLGWSLDLLSRAGVPYLVILDAFESVVQEDQHRLGEGSFRRLQNYASMIGLIESWVETAQGRDGPTHGQEEFSNAIVSGRLAAKLDSLRAKLETATAPEALDLLDRIRIIEERIRFMT